MLSPRPQAGFVSPEVVQVTPSCINEIVREQRGITADTALRLGRFFNTSHEFRMNLQANDDIECAQAEAGNDIAHIQPWAGIGIAFA